MEFGGIIAARTESRIKRLKEEIAFLAGSAT